eukprot:Partr_v1_DN28445_c2_g2_i1_m41566 putative 26S proteasome
MVVAVTSAAGMISLLEEQNSELAAYALKELNLLVDRHWPEIADSIGRIEELYENPKFAQKEMAALVLSKVYYHLGEFEESVAFALGAGQLFQLDQKSNLYIDTIVGKSIDKYIQIRQEGLELDPRLQSIVERMFQRCFDDQEFKQAIGIALDARRLDVLEKAINQSKSKQELMLYTLEVAMSLVQNVEFRNMVLKSLVGLYRSLPDPDYFSVCQCLLWLGDHGSLADILLTLIKGSDVQLLTAYQIAFDLYEYGTQDFVSKVQAKLQSQKPAVSATSTSSDMETSSDPLSRALSVISGKESIKLHLEFLFRNNKTDKLLLDNMMTSLDSRNSMFHSALTFAHAFMNAGTTSDQFLRDNMDWLSKASLWAKFSATAQLGVVHMRNLANSRSLLSPYLPREEASVTSSPYVEGGALYALGLIHANHGGESLTYLKEKLKSQNEVVQHGACLGVGVAAMALEDKEIYEAIKTILFTDSAVAGEAAGIAMGLVMLGSGSQSAIDELLQYARETQHEKIIRGIAVGIALIAYQKEDAADTLIELLLADKDAILRYAGAHVIALAYVGTSSNKAIRKLLHIAVSDVNDDVRRAAVSALGFVLVRTPGQVPRIVQLLSESYNPHVRYGAAMALGIACAGTGMKEALDLLEPLTKDMSDYVRQGAYLAASMILIQQNDTNSYAQKYRTTFTKVISAKHEDPLAKFGAVLASGIIDAGGRNVTIRLVKDGHLQMTSVVGVALFMQFWWWFPCTHFLSLSLTPTCLIGLNKDLAIPKFECISNAKPSVYAYPAPVQPKKDDKVEKVATVVLSTTAKAKARAKKTEKKDDQMETDSTVASPTTPTATTAAEEETPKPKENEKPKVEPVFTKLENMARVVPSQVAVVAFPKESRYVPVKRNLSSGILILKDLRPTEKEELLEFSTPNVSAVEEEKEAPPPEPFEYIE